MNNYNDRTQWADFLAEFSARNRSRRARFEHFEWRGVHEEDQEAHLENISVGFDGEDAPRVVITRTDTSTAEPRTLTTTIPRVKRISPQFDVDNSEAGLKIEDEQNTLTVLRMESRVDGVS